MKVKELSQRQQKKVFEQNLSFEEWLDFFIKQPTRKELDEMELHASSNNTNYQPRQGA